MKIYSKPLCMKRNNISIYNAIIYASIHHIGDYIWKLGNNENPTKDGIPKREHITIPS